MTSANRPSAGGNEAKRSRRMSESGPSDTRVSSSKVMPTRPSDPVFSVSASNTICPRRAGTEAPARRMTTVPVMTLIRPAGTGGCALAAAAFAGAIAQQAATRHPAIQTRGFMAGIPFL